MGEPPSRATVVLKVPPRAKLVQSRQGEIMERNLLAMVNDPECSDLYFLCSDGGRVHALRLLLVAMARSSVLKSLLTNGMSESRLTEISLPAITTAAMLTTVEFLYTGTIVRNKVTLVSGFQTLQASRFLMLDALEEYVVHVLVATVKEGVMGAEVMDAELLGWCFEQFAELNTEGKPVLNEVDSGIAELVCDMAQKLQATDVYPFKNLSVQAFDLYRDALIARKNTVHLSRSFWDLLEELRAASS